MAQASSEICRFSKGIRRYRADLLEIQLDCDVEPRNPNLHEPVEEDWIRWMLDRIATASLGLWMSAPRWAITACG